MTNEGTTEGTVLDVSDAPAPSKSTTSASLPAWAPTGDLMFDLMAGRLTIDSAGPFGTDM